MAIKILATNIILLLCTKVYSQIKIHPTLGVSFINNRIVEHEGILKPSKLWLNQYLGCDVTYTHNKHLFGFSTKLSAIGLGTTAYHIDFDNNYDSPISKNNFSIGMLNLGGFYSTNLKTINLFKTTSRYENNESKEIADYFKTNPNYLIQFRIEPIIGLNLLKSEKNVNWSTGNSSIVINGGSDTIDISSGWNTSKFIGKTYFGLSTSFGFKFQFFNEKRDKMAFSVLYNLGLIDMLKTSYSISQKANSGKIVTFNGTYASNGTYLAFALSYPITIVNKKGERYRDRHPKE